MEMLGVLVLAEVGQDSGPPMLQIHFCRHVTHHGHEFYQEAGIAVTQVRE
jgi:hypothetical protein